MKILAFLQNQWFHDPEGVKRSIERYGEKYRRRLIVYALFAGCLTGRRLKKALGEELCSQIVWEEGSREISGNASQFFPPDVEHIKARIDAERPDVVILFGKANREIVHLITSAEPRHYLVAPHPAARQATVPGELKELGNRLMKLMERTS